ncbi:hypothetical protein [Lactobacillus phage Bassarid]|nr:hypothetical protein [Lactobacillus phage Bassarid]
MDIKKNLALTARKAAKASAMLIPATSQQPGLLTAENYNNIGELFNGRKVVPANKDITSLSPGFYIAPTTLTGTPTITQEPTPYSWFVDVTTAYNGDKVIVLTALASGRVFKKVFPHAETNNNPTGWQMLQSETPLWEGTLNPVVGTPINLSDNVANYQALVFYCRYASLTSVAVRAENVAVGSSYEIALQHISDGSTDCTVKLIKFNVTANAKSLSVLSTKVIKADLSKGTAVAGTDLSGLNVFKITGVK